MQTKNNFVIINRAFEEAEKSTCRVKIGSVITKGKSKIVFSGHNTNQRTSYLNKISCCLHAEISSLIKFDNMLRRKGKKKINMKKYRLWVYRMSSKNNKENFILNSNPCHICCKILRTYGFQKVGYSTDLNTTLLVNLRKHNNFHMSNSQIKSLHLWK